MAQLAPVLLALILNLSGFYIFRKPQGINGPSGGGSGSSKSSGKSVDDYDNSEAPLMSSVLFAIAVVILILDTRLYPKCFRELHWFIDHLYQYIMATFILEYTLNDFWFPFENWALCFLPKSGLLICHLFEKLGHFQCLARRIVEVTSMPEAIFAWSYFISSMFLISVLHATCILDFRILLRCGPCAFLEDIMINFQLIKENILLQICGECVTKPPGCPPGCPTNRNSRIPPGVGGVAGGIQKRPIHKNKRNDSDTHACNECSY